MRGHPIAWTLLAATFVMEGDELIESLLAGDAVLSNYFPWSMLPYAAIKLLAFPNILDVPVHSLVDRWTDSPWPPHVGVVLIIAPLSFVTGWLLDRVAVRLGYLKVLAGYCATSAATGYLLNLAIPHFFVV